MASNSDVANMVKLINSLSIGSQDDTDPNNVTIQRFLSPQDTLTYVENNSTQIWIPPAPVENAQLAELVSTFTWGTSGFKWAGDGSPVTFNWNQGGKYS